MLSTIDNSSENYFFGDLQTMDKVSLPENIKIFTPVTGGGDAIKFNYATTEDIRTYNLEMAFITKGILTIKTIIKRDTVEGELSDNALFPKMENYAQLSIILDPKETITFLRQKGDTVKEKEVIARKNSAQFFLDQINLNEEKILSLRQQSEASLVDIDQGIVNSEEAVRIDSTSYKQAVQLSSSGYVSIENLELLKLKWQKDKRSLFQLIASKVSVVSKMRLEVQRLNLSNVQLKARAKAAELQAEVRSTANGILIDVRQILSNNKTHVTFVIKRMK